MFWGLVIGLTAYNMVIFAEIVRAGVASLPRGQREAALATGLTNGQTMRIVLLPQAFRIMLPAIISQLVVVLKDTSLVTFVANYDELLSQGESIQRNLDNPIQTFTVVALIYIAINYTLGRLAQYLQRAAGPPGTAAWRRPRRSTRRARCPSAEAPDARRLPVSTTRHTRPTSARRVRHAERTGPPGD